MAIKTHNVKMKKCKSEGLLDACSQRHALVFWHVCHLQLSLVTKGTEENKVQVMGDRIFKRFL